MKTAWAQTVNSSSTLLAGRKPRTQGIGLETLGVAIDEKTGAIKVDDFSRTNVPGVWAIGDVTDRINLTPVALMEGMAFAATCFGGQETRPDYDFVPCAVFCTPPMGSVGKPALHNMCFYHIARAIGEGAVDITRL